MKWSKSHVYSSLHICWGAQAALYARYEVTKENLPQKLCGIYKSSVEQPKIHYLEDLMIFLIIHNRDIPNQIHQK